MSNLLVLHGPNLNLLGSREPEIYGHQTLSDIDQLIREMLEGAGHVCTTFQSNAEHELIDAIHAAREKVKFIIINPGAFTHTSIALRDALLGVDIPFIEVHLSNVFAREEFRSHSYLSDIAVGCITGLGASGYGFAADYAIDYLGET
ncbi:MAG: 3-dehydroquinate dehydratase-2 [Candidatus Azotimanducaceae bacterium]|jgi:3-dehydroquinate dehydratase-2